MNEGSPKTRQLQLRDSTARLGITTIGVFLLAFVGFSFLNSDFHPLNDYLSKLGAVGQPFALWWNAIGFIVVGTLFSLFGVSLGKDGDDHLAGFMLGVSGIAFALGAVPTDFDATETALSRVHFASICISMAGWCFALAKFSHSSPYASLKRQSNIAAMLLGIPIIGVAVGLLSEPIAHRLLLAVVFGWVISLVLGSPQRAPS